ncbi:TetR/AcrR family transcriptional regulator [Streptomyces mirabilis]|uniref:TetR/AcrR family transcriptional regulator n=1 Tax=Streptomyces mirabilis TaxID=68239 RepID=UPI00367D1452
MAGAIAALREKGFAGASAREIARHAECNQSLVFYHFGSVVNLLLAALDAISDVRSVRYRDAVEESGSLGELVNAAKSIFDEDLDNGYVAVLAELIAGAQSTPGLGAEVAARTEPWRDFTANVVEDVLAGTPLAVLAPPQEIAHGIVALYLGLEMLAGLDGERGAALALFDRASLAAILYDAFMAKEGPQAPQPQQSTKENE